MSRSNNPIKWPNSPIAHPKARSVTNSNSNSPSVSPLQVIFIPSSPPPSLTTQSLPFHWTLIRRVHIRPSLFLIPTLLSVSSPVSLLESTLPYLTLPNRCASLRRKNSARRKKKKRKPPVFGCMCLCFAGQPKSTSRLAASAFLPSLLESRCTFYRSCADLLFSYGKQALFSRSIPSTPHLQANAQLRSNYSTSTLRRKRLNTPGTCLTTTHHRGRVRDVRRHRGSCHHRRPALVRESKTRVESIGYLTE